MYKVGLAGLLFLVAASSSASTNEAWAKLERDATRKCVAASEYRRPRVSNPIMYNDDIGVVAILVTGTYRQARMKGATGTSLCLYNRRSGSASLEETAGWSSSGR